MTELLHIVTGLFSAAFLLCSFLLLAVLHRLRFARADALDIAYCLLASAVCAGIGLGLALI